MALRWLVPPLGCAYYRLSIIVKAREILNYFKIKNEERADILKAIKEKGQVYGR